MSNPTPSILLAATAIGTLFYGVHALTTSGSKAAPMMEAVAVHPVAAETQSPSARGAGGLGMTYSGKIGIEIAPGLVMTTSGSLRPGFGF